MSYRWVAGVVVAVGVYVARAWPSLATTVDDAWISARYAQHAADGYGLVYNAGEPAIEGYTNLLWTLWLTFGIVLDTVRLDHWMVGSGLVFGCLTVIFAGLLARALAQTGPRTREVPWWVPGIASLLVALDLRHAVVSTNGLESSMFNAAVLGSAWAVVSARGNLRWLAGFATGMLVTIRPDGFVVAAALVVIGMLQSWSDGPAPLKKRASDALPYVMPPIVLGTLLEVWRKLSYGDWVPNTFHAKAKGALTKHVEQNLQYLGGDWPIWAAAAIAALLALAIGWRDLRRWLLAGAALVIVAVAFRVNLWMPGGRLLVPALLFTFVLVGASATRRAGQVLAAVMLAGWLIAPFTSMENRLRRYDRVHSVVMWNGTAIAALHIQKHAPEGSWLGVRDAGVLAHFVGSGVRVAELHHRALTQLHPDGRDSVPTDYTPANPEFIALTQNREKGVGYRYGRDRLILMRTTVPYRYLGRVHQHYHRYYDLYVRADVDMPPLPPNIVRSKLYGPKAPHQVD